MVIEDTDNESGTESGSILTDMDALAMERLLEDLLQILRMLINQINGLLAEKSPVD